MAEAAQGAGGAAGAGEQAGEAARGAMRQGDQRRQQARPCRQDRRRQRQQADRHRPGDAACRQRDRQAQKQGHHRQIAGPVHQRKRRGAVHAPAGFAAQPAHPHQFSDAAGGHAHREAAKEMAQVLQQPGGQAKAARQQMPAQPARQIVAQRQRQQHAHLRRRQPGDLCPGLGPAGGRGQPRQPRAHRDQQATDQKPVAPAAVLGGSSGHDAFHWPGSSHRFGQECDAVARLATVEALGKAK